MNKLDLARDLAERGDMTRVRAMEVITLIFDADEGILSNALHEGEKITLAGFGTFYVRSREARNGVNPITQERIQIPAKKSVGYRVGKNLRLRISG